MLVAVFCLYLVALLAIGYAASRYPSSVDGFFLADRRQGAWVTAISSAASSESGWVTLGLVGMGYSQGLSSMWFVFGCLMGFLVNWYIVAPRLRRLSARQGSLTIPDFLEEVTGDRTMLRLVAVVIIFLCMMGYVGAQFTAAGKTFQVVFDFDYRLGVIIGAAITILYTLMGGYRAVSWTDLVQGLLMAFGLVILPFYLIFFHPGVEGLAGLFEQADRMPPRAVLKLEVSTGGAIPNKATGYLEGGTLWIASAGTPGTPRFAQQGQEAVVALHGMPPGRIGLGVPAGETLVARPDGGASAGPYVTIINESDTKVVVGDGGGRVLVPPHQQAAVAVADVPAIHWGQAVISGEIKATEPGRLLGGLTLGKTGLALLGLILGGLGIGLGYPGQPHVLTRYMAAENEEVIRGARVIAIAWGVLALNGAVWLGYSARALLPDLADPEFAYPAAATAFLTPALAGLLVAAIIAAIMSTADSQLLVAASAVARDIYQKVVKRDEPVSERRIVVISRVIVLLLGLAGLATALGEARVVFWFVLLAWSGLGASFGPPILLALFWKGLTRWGVLAGMVVGFGTTAAWSLYIRDYLAGRIGFDLYELVPAFVLSFLATWLVSLATASRRKEG